VNTQHRLHCVNVNTLHRLHCVKATLCTCEHSVLFEASEAHITTGYQISYSGTEAVM